MDDDDVGEGEDGKALLLTSLSFLLLLTPKSESLSSSVRSVLRGRRKRRKQTSGSGRSKSGDNEKTSAKKNSTPFLFFTLRRFEWAEREKERKSETTTSVCLSVRENERKNVWGKTRSALLWTHSLRKKKGAIKHCTRTSRGRAKILKKTSDKTNRAWVFFPFCLHTPVSRSDVIEEILIGGIRTNNRPTGTNNNRETLKFASIRRRRRKVLSFAWHFGSPAGCWWRSNSRWVRDLRQIK